MKMHIDKVHMTDVKKEVKDTPYYHSKRGRKTNIIYVVMFCSFSFSAAINDTVQVSFVSIGRFIVLSVLLISGHFSTVSVQVQILQPAVYNETSIAEP